MAVAVTHTSWIIGRSGNEDNVIAIKELAFHMNSCGNSFLKLELIWRGLDMDMGDFIHFVKYP